MSSEKIAVILASMISVFGIWILLFGLYRDYAVDRFRQEMFSLRDSLFDQADGGRVSFDHPAYGMLRSTMNGFIRFGHRLSLGQVLIARWLPDRSGVQVPTFQERWDAFARDLSPEARKMLQMYVLRMNIVVLKHLVLGSPLLTVTVVVPVALWIVIKASLIVTLRPLAGTMDSIDGAAFVCGEQRTA